MDRQTFTRSGNPPHIPSLADAIRSKLTGSFHIFVRPGFVDIEAGTWEGVTLSAVQADVTAAPDATPKVDAKYLVDTGLPTVQQALVLVLLDEINLLRANTIWPMTARTIAQLRTALKNKIDAL